MTLILSNEDVNQVLTMPECLEILEDAYRGLHSGTAVTRRRSDCLTPTERDDAVYGFKTMDGVIPNQGVSAVSGVVATGSELSVLDNGMLPEQFKLYSAYPNPFNPATSIKFDIATTTDVNIQILDISGKHVDQILYSTMVPGSYEVQWNAEGIPSGVYFVYMNVGSQIFSEKVLLVK